MLYSYTDPEVCFPRLRQGFFMGKTTFVHYLIVVVTSFILFLALFTSKAFAQDYRVYRLANFLASFAKNYIEGTFNAYGWGQGTIPFDSWADGIAKISSKLRSEYIQKGASSIEQINPVSLFPKSGFRHPPLTI